MVKRILRSPVTTLILFAMAAGLLLAGTIGGVRAAPLLETAESYRASMVLSSIGIEVTENGLPVEEGSALFQNLLSEGERFQVGRRYSVDLAVRNSGDIGEYTRVTAYRWWESADGVKVPELDPELIEFELADGWLQDTEHSTDERIVLYYGRPLEAGESAAVINSLSINGGVVRAISAQGGTNDYNGLRFHVELVADGVQERNAGAAIPSAWGNNFLGVTD